MKNFITNSESDNLKKRLIELISKSEELKFLVGFFYFSGIHELYDGLKKNPNTKIKVLVGLSVDKTNKGILELAEQDYQLSDEEKSYKFLCSIKNSINRKEFDTEEFYKQVKFFLDLIKEDKLVIRKSYNPNHAKLYIFKLEKEQIGRKNLFITGSSNLTRAGLTTQEEFNVEISDYGFETAEEYFDTLWDEAVKITEDDITKTKLIETIENQTLVKEISPFEAFVLVLKIYLDSFEQKEISESLVTTLEKNGYTPYQYQLDAVRQSLAIIEKNNGVIIADVVGLGKTVIACSVAKELKKRGVVICPPGIVGDKNKTFGWKKYIEEFGLYDWEVRSLGELENISKFVQTTEDIDVIIIDEAHRFRNQDTKDYEFLKNICRNKIVMLLTATPFNNKPDDILSLLKLFITPKKSAITLENNLVNKFKHFKGAFDRLGYISKYWNSLNESKRKKAENYYETMFGDKNIQLDKVKRRSHYLAKQIRNVIEPVTIRRNRLDLQGNPFYKQEAIHLSTLNDPEEWYFELSENQSEFYDTIISKCFGDPEEGGQFKGAIYKPFEYEEKRKDKLSEKENFQFVQQRNLYDFMRRLIVKRFESSFGSFERSIKNFKNVTTHVLGFIEKTDKFILDRSLLEKIYNFDVEEIEKRLEEFSEKLLAGDYPKNNRVYDVSRFVYKKEFIDDIKSDLDLFKKILKELSELNLVKNDPKSDCLIRNIKEVLSERPKKNEPKRKIIIFSEYLDTVKYLKPILETEFGERVLTIDGTLSSKKNAEINKNFDASSKEQEDKYDILLTSDKISEGYNLNRAGMVINYDIPWNPVRVIQRVGRINRISKKVFNNLYLVNFFPTEKGSTIVKSREIAEQKMFLIHNTLGEDAKIFDIDEEPTPAGLFERIQKNPDSLEEESFYNKALREFVEIKKEFPDLVKEIANFPSRIKVSKHFNDNELFVFIKKGCVYIHSISYDDEEKNKIYDITLEEIFDHIKCKNTEKLLPRSDLFWDYYEKIKNRKGQKALPVSEQSFEQRALNNLKSFISKPQEDILPLMDFIRTLREDIIDYGTLSDYTLRRIGNLGFAKKGYKTAHELEKLKQELGEDYLLKEKEKQQDLSKEIIIAIENQKL
ncbi:MAG TPA: helicase [Ignavibacteria bacterium]|nr:helicase [Ignavibacteria bacterium]